MLLPILKRAGFNNRKVGHFLKIRQFSSGIQNPQALGLKNFVTTIIENDIANGKNGGRVLTRFPPEPNGYLHLGHAKAVNFNFEVAKQFNGHTNMRFDDTNPAKEEMEFIKSILDDVRWLLSGQTSDSFKPWNGEIRHASDYFPQLYAAAEYLISKGLAYVDDLSVEQMREYRGNRTDEPGRESPYRNRSIEENLHLFRQMKSGVFPDGHCVLRAKIDMSSGNMNMRDPPLYRIKRESHPITHNEWCIYPMYDFAHALSDALEGITHSLCSLEFENHRSLYDWAIDNVMASGILPYRVEGYRPNQYEFSRLNLQYTVLSKRKLIQLVQEKYVSGWDDPRMPTICGLRRRGYPHTAIQLFCQRVGVTKTDSNVDMYVLEECVREVLESTAPRLFAVPKPLKVTITNWNDDDPNHVEIFTAENHPKRPELGSREIPFTRSVYIDRDDFFDCGVDGNLHPPKGYKRLVKGGQVRLRATFVITCQDVIRDVHGTVCELLCIYHADTRGGVTPEGSPKVKGIIPWVSVQHAVPVKLMLYDRLFLTANPSGSEDFLKELNPESCVVCEGAVVEPSVLTNVVPGATYQFERQGYFTVDTSSKAENLVFNRVVTLKDTWSPQQQHQSQQNQVSAKQTTTSNVTSDVSPLPTSNASNAVTQKKSSSTGADSNVEDIRRLELRVGLVLSAEKHPDADSLYVERVDCGDAAGPRTIISGLVKYMSVSDLVGKKVVVLCNLKPSKMRGILSEGMLLAASNDTHDVVELVTPPNDAMVGELIHVNGYDAPQPDVQLKSKSAQEVWKRVAPELITNSNREATFGSSEGVLVTKTGPCVVSSLVGAAIR